VTEALQGKGISGGFAAIFADDRRFWRWSAVILGVVAFLKGVHLPNLWAATQAQVDYRDGFVKRGLFGEVLSRPLHLYHYAAFARFSFAILFLMILLLVVYVLRSGLLERAGNGEVLAVFSASYAVTYLASLAGYFDILLAAITIGLLLIRNDTLRMMLGLPLCIAGVLIHESFLIVFLPVLLLSFGLSALSGKDEKACRRSAWKGAVLLIVTVCTALRTAAHASLGPAKIQAMEDQIAARTDFLPRPDFFQVMGLSFAANVHIMVRLISRPGWAYTQMVSCIVFLPTVILLLLAARQILGSAKSIREPVGMGMVLLAAVCPLAMHFLGWDVARWNALFVFNVFLVLLTVCAFTRGEHVALSPAWRRGAVLAIALSMASGELLMYGVRVNNFPFSNAAVQTIMTTRHHGWTAPAQ